MERDGERLREMEREIITTSITKSNRLSPFPLSTQTKPHIRKKKTQRQASFTPWTSHPLTHSLTRSSPILIHFTSPAHQKRNHEAIHHIHTSGYSSERNESAPPTHAHTQDSLKPPFRHYKDQPPLLQTPISLFLAKARFGIFNCQNTASSYTPTETIPYHIIQYQSRPSGK